MARFKLVKESCPEYGPTVSEADHANELAYDELHGCSIWSVWVTCDDGATYRTAYVNWISADFYEVVNEYDNERTFVRGHNIIIPVIRGIIIYNDIFKRYRKFNPKVYVSVQPVST